jgi:hypothetical protein
MSHVAEGVCRVHDLDLLESAAADMSRPMELVRDRKTYTWYGRFLNDWRDKTRAAALKGADTSTFGKCDHVLRFKDAKPGEYEIGVKAAPDGDGYRLEYDAYSGGGRAIEAACGQDLTVLADEYNAQMTARTLARQGMRVRRVVSETGEIQMIGVKN